MKGEHAYKYTSKQANTYLLQKKKKIEVIIYI